MPKPDRLAQVTWWLVIAAVVLYCLVSFFFWSLMDVVTPFGVPFVWLPVLGTALAAVLTAVILPIRRWSARRAGSLLPLAWLIGCFVVTRCIDFTALWLSANFRFRYTDREQVVRRIESGELRPNVSHSPSLLALPRELAPVSLGGGEVVVQRDGDKLRILFFTFRGVLDRWAGFVYSSDGSPPRSSDFGGELTITRKIQDRWYHVAAH